MNDRTDRGENKYVYFWLIFLQPTILAIFFLRNVDSVVNGLFSHFWFLANLFARARLLDSLLLDWANRKKNGFSVYVCVRAQTIFYAN